MQRYKRASLLHYKLILCFVIITGGITKRREVVNGCVLSLKSIVTCL